MGCPRHPCRAPVGLPRRAGVVSQNTFDFSTPVQKPRSHGFLGHLALCVKPKPERFCAESRRQNGGFGSRKRVDLRLIHKTYGLMGIEP